jgi:hypothetical protein
MTFIPAKEKNAHRSQKFAKLLKDSFQVHCEVTFFVTALQRYSVTALQRLKRYGETQVPIVIFLTKLSKKKLIPPGHLN